MRKAEYVRQMQRRIARAEADANATILRAFDKVLRTLEREKTELEIYLDRRKKGVKR